MKVGFTGTRSGCTDEQRFQLRLLLLLLNGETNGPITEFHHGNCVGADHLAASLARKMELRVIAHPCDMPVWQAPLSPYDEMRLVKPPLDRNHDIVDETDALIATPRTMTEQRRGSGTWATIRYARSRQRPLWVIFPDGSIAKETASSAV